MDISKRALRDPDSVGMKKRFLRISILKLVLLGLALASMCAWLISEPRVSQAQVLPPAATSITPSGSGNLGTQVLPPNNHVYGITGGKTIGTNLFHSFGEFTIKGGDVAQFQTSNLIPNALMSNILGRVTGGNPSSIFGTIDSATYYPTANLFLMNPSGIVFGPTASLNVGGSVSFTNAQYIRLFDGVNKANFYANPTFDALPNSILVMEPSLLLEFLSPAAYGFLTEPGPTATITVQGNTLSVPSGQSISLVGGKVIIEGGAQLSAPNGRIHLATTASPGEFAALPGESLANTTSLRSVLNNPVDPASATSFASYGLMSLAPGSSIDVHGASTVWIKGGQLVLSVNDATLNTSPNPAPPLDTVSLSSGSRIVTSTSEAEAGPDVQITVGTLNLDGASIQSMAAGDGPGGAISIGTDTVSLTNGAQIVSSTTGDGNGGNITIATTNTANSSVTISGFDTTGTLSGVTTPVLLDPNTGLPVPVVTSGVFSMASGSGNGGLINITAPTVNLSNVGTIATVNSGGGVPNQKGGDVQIVAGNLQMDGAFIQSTTSGDGSGGNITTNGDTVSLLNGAQIVSSTSGTGAGGNITISSTDSVLISGYDITGTLSGVTANLFDANTFAPVVTTGVFTTASTSGNGGAISITAPIIAADSAGTITTINTGDGRGGDVSLSGTSISFTNGGQLLSSTGFDYPTFNPIGTGPGGNVTVTGTDSILLSGVNPNLVSLTSPTGLAASSIQSITYGGNGGSITANVGTLSLTDGAMINTTNSSVGVGQGGNVTIQGLLGEGSAADAVNLSSGASISSTTSAAGRGGDVVVTAGTLKLEDGSAISSETDFGDGAGGDITLNVGTLTLMGGPLGRSEIRSTNFNFGTNLGGNVTVQGIQEGSAADSVTLSGGSRVISETSEASGAGGMVTIAATSLTMTGVSELGEATSINSSTFGTGLGGDIVVSVQRLNISDGATITSHTDLTQSNAGAGGSVTVQGLNGRGSTVLLSGQNTGIVSDSSGQGKPGNITLLDASSLTITRGAMISAGSPHSLGAGDVTVEANSIVISDQGSIVSQSFARDSGRVKITANELTISNAPISHGSIETSTSSQIGGRGGDVELDVGTLRLTNGAAINSKTFFTGPAGNITILASGPVSMTSGSTISASSTGSGIAGQVALTTPALTMDNASLTTSTSSSGSAGSIMANVGTLNLTNGSTISSSSTGTASGNAGGIAIQGRASPADSVTITGSSLLTSAANTGQGGSITVNATNLALNNATVSASVKDFNAANPNDGPAVGTGNVALSGSNITMTGSTVTTESSGLRNAGDIRINPNVPGNSFEMQNSMMNTSASLSDGGNIAINVSNMFRMTNSLITSSVGNPQKTDTFGGNITIDPQFVILQNSQILAQAFAGTGGNITITANTFLADPNSLVDASSQLGVSGVVDIRSPVSNISGIIGRMPESVLAAQALLRAACAAKLAESQVSTFVERGRDSIPLGPDGLLATPYIPPSSESSVQMGAARWDSAPESFGSSGVQVRRLFGSDLTPRVHLLSGDIACGS